MNDRGEVEAYKPSYALYTSTERGEDASTILTLGLLDLVAAVGLPMLYSFLNERRWVGEGTGSLSE